MRFRLRFLRLAVFACAGIALAMPGLAQNPPAQTQPKPPTATTPTPAKDPVVATVNGQAIRLSEIQAMQQELPPQYRNMPLEAVFPALLDRLISAKLVVIEGRKHKVQDDAAYKKRLAMVEEQVLQQFWIEKEIAKAVTPETLKAKYEAKIKAMPPEEEVKARHILLAKEDEAVAVIAELKKGGSFEKIAREKSTDKASGADGGDLGWFKKSDMVPEFASAAFAMEKGKVSEAPVKTQFGFHVIEVQDRRQAAPPSFDDMAEQLREEMTRDTVTTLLNGLRASAKIEKFNPDGSKAADTTKPGTPPAAAPTKPATPPK